MSFKKTCHWLSNFFNFEINSFSLTNNDLTSSLYMCYLTYKTLTDVCSKITFRRNYRKNSFKLHNLTIFCKGSHSSSNPQDTVNQADCQDKQTWDTHTKSFECLQSKKFSMNIDKTPVCEENTIFKKKRPNHFIAIQITDDEVHSSVKKIQEHILLKNVSFKKFMISRNTLHVTLMVLHLQDSEDHFKAVKALKVAQQVYNDSFNEKPLKLEFCGVGHFQNKVLFAKIKENDSYKHLCDFVKSIHSHLERVGLKSTDLKKEFTPHLTIAKVKYNKSIKLKYKKILPLLYQDFTDLHFGCNVVKSIQLLKMQGPKTALGYYSGEELLFDCNDQILLKKLNSVYTIAEKKKSVKSKVSTITKKLSM